MYVSSLCTGPLRLSSFTLHTTGLLDLQWCIIFYETMFAVWLSCVNRFASLKSFMSEYIFRTNGSVVWRCMSKCCIFLIILVLIMQCHKKRVKHYEWWLSSALEWVSGVGVTWRPGASTDVDLLHLNGGCRTWKTSSIWCAANETRLHLVLNENWTALRWQGYSLNRDVRLDFTI